MYLYLKLLFCFCQPDISISLKTWHF